MTPPLDKQLLGERVRMARASLKESRPAFGERFGLGEGTLRRVEGGTIAWKDYEIEGFVSRLVDETGLAREFFTEEGPPPADDPTADLDQLGRIEARILEIQRQVAELSEIVREVAAANVEALMRSERAAIAHDRPEDAPDKRAQGHR